MHLKKFNEGEGGDRLLLSPLTVSNTTMYNPRIPSANIKEKNLVLLFPYIS